jgi:RNA polymerase sigma factor (sigma-70 family)
MKPEESSQESRIEAIHDSKVPEDLAAHRERIAALCIQHERALLRMLTKRGCSPQEARDIAQEAYVKLLSLDKAGAISFLEGYLWRIAGNLAIDRARGRRYREELARTLAREPPSTYPSPESECIASQRIKILEEVLTRLPEKCRIAFKLRMLEGLPPQVAAAQMGIDVSGVNKYAARALVEFRLALDAAEREQMESSG